MMHEYFYTKLSTFIHHNMSSQVSLILLN